MYSDEIKKNCRKIRTGLYGKENLTILESVEGQLSDGMWENSPMMEGYWMFECVGLENDEVVIYISNLWCEHRWGRVKTNRFFSMGDNEIITWFAKKIKQIIKQEEKDHWENHPITWKRNCEEPSYYMHDDIPVSLCYKAYDQLLGRSI